VCQFRVGMEQFTMNINGGRCVIVRTAVKFMETNIATSIVVLSLLVYAPVAFFAVGRRVCFVIV